MARPSNKAERRRQIAEALMHVMAAEGYSGATIAEIARKAGLTAGLIHYHFKSKLEVLLEMLSIVEERHHGRLSAAMEGAEGDVRKELVGFLDSHLAIGSTADPDGLAAWVAMGGEALRDAEVARAYGAAQGRIHAILEGIVERGVATGVFVCEDERAATAGLLAVVQGYFAVAATARHLIPRRTAATTARRMAEGLLGCSLEDA